MSIKEKCDEILPGSLDSLDATESAALVVLLSVLVLVSLNGLTLNSPLVREAVSVCLFVLFGSKFMKIRGGL